MHWGWKDVRSRARAGRSLRASATRGRAFLELPEADIGRADVAAVGGDQGVRAAQRSLHGAQATLVVKRCLGESPCMTQTELLSAVARAGPSWLTAPFRSGPQRA